MPGSGDLFAAKWQYTQFIPSCFTCLGWGKSIGWSGCRPSGDDAPLYADTTVASAAMSATPGTAAHFLLVVTFAPSLWEVFPDRLVKEFTRPFRRPGRYPR